MEMIYVESSNIDSIGYDPDQAILHIKFTSGELYEYYDVPSYVFDELLSSSSKGKYAHENIYDVYRGTRI